MSLRHILESIIGKGGGLTAVPIDVSGSARGGVYRRGMKPRFGSKKGELDANRQPTVSVTATKHPSGLPSTRTRELLNLPNQRHPVRTNLTPGVLHM